MKEATLIIGNQTLNFTKSEYLIAIKPQSNQQQAARSVIRATTGIEEAEANTLGGFILVKAENTPQERRHRQSIGCAPSK